MITYIAFFSAVLNDCLLNLKTKETLYEIRKRNTKMFFECSYIKYTSELCASL